MASDIWLRSILIVKKETRCRHIGYSFRLTARVLLYAPSHRQDNTYHGLCYTSRGAQKNNAIMLLDTYKQGRTRVMVSDILRIACRSTINLVWVRYKYRGSNKFGPTDRDHPSPRSIHPVDAHSRSNFLPNRYQSSTSGWCSRNATCATQRPHDTVAGCTTSVVSMTYSTET